MNNKFEVIIIGGSYSGLSAAMALGRASRQILVIDSGEPCNRYTPHSHNFITHDGETPAAIAAKAREQVLAYPTVTFKNSKAVKAIKTSAGFEVSTAGGETYTSLKLLFTTGVTDVLPDITGFEACWGKSVIHCPYCHGYEVKGEKTAILANGNAAYHYAMLLGQWTTDLTIFTNGPTGLTAEHLLKLKQHNITVVEAKITALQHTDGNLESILLQNGDIHKLGVMYTRPETRQHCTIPLELGCEINEQGLIVVDELQRTSIPGIYAAGDCTTPLRAVAVAVAAGMKAGAGINNDFIFG